MALMRERTATSAIVPPLIPPIADVRQEPLPSDSVGASAASAAGERRSFARRFWTSITLPARLVVRYTTRCGVRGMGWVGTSGVRLPARLIRR